MAYSTNVSFHGVGRIEIGKPETLVSNGREPWKSVSINLFNNDGEWVDTIYIHSDNNELVIERQRSNNE